MASLLRSLLNRKWFRVLTAWVFTNMNFVIPVDRLVETKTLLAFRHPTPAYPVHILIVPKKACASLMELAPSDAELLNDLYTTVQTLVRQLHLEEGGYRLIVNGGPYQDFPQLHFHLISE
jgi:histidine triad (HIT) family protein